jgi:hypothetical protein
MKHFFATCLLIYFSMSLFAQLSKPTSLFQIARVKYNGGGDWYNDPSAEVNLLNFIRQNTNIKTNPEYKFVELTSENLFSYPFIFLTGHGTPGGYGAINFSEIEVKRLRSYLENGGFLYVDDDYGLDASFRKEIKKVFPDRDLVELPFNYGLYHCQYDFPNGPPKTHEHDNKPPQGYGIFHNERLVVFYTYESNPSDGWADPESHHDPEEKRIEALKFGTNIVVWALTN